MLPSICQKVHILTLMGGEAHLHRRAVYIYLSRRDMMKRRFLCVLLALSMALTLLPPAALAFGEDGSGHNYSKFWSKDKNTHWHICTDEGHEGEKGDEAEHDWDEGTVTMKPTYAEPGERTFTCTVCRQFKTEPIAQLVHHYAEEWS